MSELDNLQNADGTEEQKETVQPTTEDNSNNDDDKVLNEIEDSNAEDAEDEGNKDRHNIEEKDYESLNMEQLVIELERLVKNEKVQAINKHVNALKQEFDKQFNDLLEEKKEEFLSNGGVEMDFRYNSPLQRSFRDTYKDYKQRLTAHYKNLEKNLKQNLNNRLEIIEQIKALTEDAEDSMSSKYKTFKDLQDQWRNAGPIPRDKYNNAWNSYHFNVERFYDLLHLDRDLRDKDFEHNLEQKTKIIEQAEALAKDDNINRAFRELQNLHKIWKEELGPVAREHREPIWDRFKEATKKINENRQDYFKSLDKLYEQNLVNKQAIIDKIAQISSENINTHKGWQNKIKEVEALREEFFKAGKVPIKVNEATWAKFKEAVRTFNRKKNQFYKDLKKEQYVNLEKKQELVKIAEENKDNEDFEVTTPLMKKIQADWKKIGHVPRKDSDKIWKQFKTACNHYFNRIKDQRNAASAEEEQAFKEKEALLAKVKELKLTGDQKEDLATIKEQINNWKNIGRVPKNKKHIEGDFNNVLDGLFKNLDLNKSEAEMIKFENKLQDLSSTDNQKVIDNERFYIQKKVDEIKGEINQLENNLQFFTNVKSDNPLVKEVHKNIKKHKEELDIWLTKLKKIKSLY
ncbi:hypothetical protein FHS04_001129 [Mesoflavibacter sabulilitoris]|uniref:DUF349 domain-containing protein n=1 Tax=Mesoflavibacter zeaxanthinifaciens subsp. sabulilitoris TaxID=1520893 RepID=A0A2T1NAU7_9FLAO|nr:DUF349 domain-containing protein [Mesoflavibacter zeaxanthinifaciens]MBB3123626.1 hypothetical protein [Mesoflavibacter zeaxanthinifaciens subsp. sabulilitoris]PSG89248.1 DUF349 domain-containing protein [Mesoflavibacter zeaxanthinifaciens subsp. sabulilitoris]